MGNRKNMVLLRLQNITKRFEGLTAIEDCSMDIHEGVVQGLIGPNGAGKTTLFNVISGLEYPTAGQVLFKDRDITKLKAHERSRLGIARTFQLISLFNGMTVLENVMAGQHARTRSGWLKSILRLPAAKREEKEIQAQGEKILEFVKLDEPESKKYDLARNLSYGEQRLLEIGRALASKPEVILLDEPGAGMNASEKLGLKEIVSGIRDMGITILFVEHDMKFAMAIADKIIVLDHGRKIAEGRPEEIQSNEAVLEAYLGRRE